MRNPHRVTFAAACGAVFVAVLAVLATGPEAGGCVITSLAAAGSAEQMTDGPYLHWYKYTYDVTWDFSKGLSHLDLILPADVVSSGPDLGFDTDVGGSQDGLSTGGDYHPGGPAVLTVPYNGAYEPRGDPSIHLAAPLVKWEPAGKPGKQGVGTFWFYADVLPAYGTFTDVVAAKYGTNSCYGDLVGAYPGGEVVHHTPEPMTAGFVGVGLAAMGLVRLRARTRRSRAV